MTKFCVGVPLPNGSFWCSTKVFVFLTLFIALSTSEVCEKVNSCRCQFRNGSVIDLESLGALGRARWQKVIPIYKDNFTYYYNPCFDFKFPKNVVTGVTQCAGGVAACQVSEYSNDAFSLGPQKSAEFKWSEKEHAVQLKYVNAIPDNISVITLKCNEEIGAKDVLVVWGKRHGENGIHMTLTSRCACPDLCGRRGLSAGSVLIILFSVFVILYLMFGMMFNKLTRGAQGWELIPNYEFWQDFPLLVRDGCVYVASGCKPDTTYERI